MESHLKNNKYYVPEISEFHVGFEFETNNVSTLPKEKQIWKQMIATPNIIGAIDYDLSTNSRERTYRNESIRVKYLDQEDIESLEWIKHATLENLYFKESQEQNLYGTTYLNINNFGKELLIEDDRTGDYLFKGTIKNKSELKRLMQQLNIK